MATRIYGASDDLIEVEGGKAAGEVGCFGTDDQPHGVLLVCSDGTLLDVQYGKGGMGIWGISVLVEGEKFGHVQVCSNEDDDPNSDQAFFADYLDWVYAATEWERVH